MSYIPIDREQKIDPVELTDRHLEILKPRFWDKVWKRGEDECWLWTGATNAGKNCKRLPYGVIKIPNTRKLIKAHILSFILHYKRPIEANEEICHRCDTTICVNPYHLFAGLKSDNMQDMIKKGRGQGQFLPSDKMPPKSDIPF